MKKRISCMLLSILLLCLCACGEKSVWRAAYERTGQALQSEVNELRVGSVGGEWCIIGLSRSGRLTSDAAHAYLEPSARLGSTRPSLRKIPASFWASPQRGEM